MSNKILNRPAERKPFRVAKPYNVTDADREAMAGRYWRLPVRLVHSGELAALWRLGEAVPAILAVLAVHAHPETGAEWSHLIRLEHERIAALSGACRRSVVSAIAALCEAGYVRQEIRAHPTERRWTLRSFYVSSKLYARAGEPYVSVDGRLIYDGWERMQSHAARHLHLVRGALAPVQNVTAYTAALPECTPEAEELVREHIERHAPSRSALSRASGMTRDAIRRVETAEREVALREAQWGFFIEDAEHEAAWRDADLGFYMEEAEPAVELACEWEKCEGGVSCTCVTLEGGVSCTGINPFTT